MKYKNLIEATDILSKYIYNFEGHSVDVTHKSFMWHNMMKGLCYMLKENALSIQYNAKLWNGGNPVPVKIILHKADNEYGAVEVDVRMLVNT